MKRCCGRRHSLQISRTQRWARWPGESATGVLSAAHYCSARVTRAQVFFLWRRARFAFSSCRHAGREQVLAVEGPGSSFAELPVFDGGNYPASASALEDAEVLFISRKDFQNFCREHPDVALKVIAVVGSRLRRLVGIIEDLSFTTVRHRLIALILRLAQESGTASKEGVHVELTKTHQDLAAELGTVRELVSRNLSRLQAEGFLEVDGRRIIVKDLAGLKREQKASE